MKPSASATGKSNNYISDKVKKSIDGSINTENATLGVVEPEARYLQNKNQVIEEFSDEPSSQSVAVNEYDYETFQPVVEATEYEARIPIPANDPNNRNLNPFVLL